jgi:broad-specificity NMP kinase
MKTIYLIGGTMGVGKTTVSQQLKQDLCNSVFLDGDWCWDANPFQVNEETKAMVIDNICYLLNNFLHCSAYENVIFCWVMHQQSIIDSIIEKLDLENCDIKCISLITDETNLRNRLTADVERGIRTADVIDRSIARIPLYQALDTIKIDTSNKTVQMIADEIKYSLKKR